MSNPTEFDELVKKSVAWFNSLSKEEQEAHLKLQKESYVRAETSWPKANFKWVGGAKVYDSYDDYCND